MAKLFGLSKCGSKICSLSCSQIVCNIALNQFLLMQRNGCLKQDDSLKQLCETCCSVAYNQFQTSALKLELNTNLLLYSPCIVYVVLPLTCAVTMYCVVTKTITNSVV